MSNPIYLDNQSTTPVDPLVIEAMIPFLTKDFGNPASVHHIYGHKAKQAVEESRNLLAGILSAQPRDIIFTSGATESINLAIKGLCYKQKGKGNHIITQKTEHKAVLDTCKTMEKKGWEITYLPVDNDGVLSPESVFDAIKKETVLVAIMHVNNEIGTIQPIKEIGHICRQEKIFFMVDACQSFGKLDIDVLKMNIDLLAATAHKIYGPKGIGLLYVSQKEPKVNLQIQIDGGGHERGKRSGTLAVHQIVGLAKAAELAIKNKERENNLIGLLRDRLLKKIRDYHPDIIINGSLTKRIPQNLNVCFPGLDAESIIMKMKNVACSTGSACSSANLMPSHVLKALGLENELAHSSIRFSLGRFNTEKEINYAAEEIINTITLQKNRLNQHRLIKD